MSSVTLQSSMSVTSPPPVSTLAPKGVPKGLPPVVTTCVSTPPRVCVDVESAVNVSCALAGSVTSTSVTTSMSIDSLERPPSDPCNASCMSSKDSISEYDTEYSSQTDECHSDSQLHDTRSDGLAQLEVASSLSIGDLSMGSDSVFISETETLSDGMSRRHSTQTINPIYCPEGIQSDFNISKSSLLSPNTKHVHFKFDADTSSTTSEDERQTDSPNFAQAVLSNYLSSHRNSISQVIEALSSLAQADITAEIEMTIEQNRKQKVCQLAEVKREDINNSSSSFDSASIPVIEITEPAVDVPQQSSELQKLPVTECHLDEKSPELLVEIKESSLNRGESEEKHKNSMDKLTGRKFGMHEKSEILVDQVSKSRAESDDEDSDTDEFEKLEKITGVGFPIEEAVLGPKSTEIIAKRDTNQEMKEGKLKTEKGPEPVVVPASVPKVQRKSILKNTGNKSKAVGVQDKDASSKEEPKIIRQATPTLRRKPILKKEVMVPSSANKQPSKQEPKQDPMPFRKSSSPTGKRDFKTDLTNVVRTSPVSSKQKYKSVEKMQEYSVRSKSLGTSDEKIRILAESRKQRTSLSEKVSVDNISQATSGQKVRRSVSLPTTPSPLRRERPLPPNKLPLVTSRESSLESLRDSRVPRQGGSNESTPASTPRQMRKFSPKSDEGFTKISKSFSREHSFEGHTSGTPKRKVWSEPSSPLSTPQLIRKTFKQIHESTKIPMPVYQYSSTEELEDSSSPQESPRSSREEKCQRSVIRPPRAVSADRAMDLTFKKTKEETPVTSRISPRTQSPLPVSPRIQSPTSGRMCSITSGRVQSPTISRAISPISSKTHSSSQGSSRRTSPGSTPRTVLSPGSTPKQVQSPASTPKTVQSPSSTPKLLRSPISTPKRVVSPLPQSPSAEDSKTGTRPKIPRTASSLLKESPVRTARQKSSSPPKYVSASDSEQHSSNVGNGRTKSSKHFRSGGMRRADSLEEFLLLENECMD